MFGILTLLPLLLIFIALLFLFGRAKIGQKKIFTVNKKFHFIVTGSFVVLLAVMTLFVEFMYPTSSGDPLDFLQSEGNSSIKAIETYQSIGDRIIAGEMPDASLLVASRTHKVGKKLEIIHNHQDFEEPVIYIDRRDTNEQVIEEYIYKPFMILNEHDITDKIDLTLPRWENERVVIPDMVKFELKTVRYIDNTMLKQFTSDRATEYHSGSISTSSSLPIIHLIVPKDFEVIDRYEDLNEVQDLRD